MLKKTILFFLILFFILNPSPVFAIEYRTESNTVQTQVGTPIEPSIGPDTPSGWPIKGPFPDCRILQGPGEEFSHRGLNAIDIALPEDTPVYASMDGTTTKVVVFDNTFPFLKIYGTYVEIKNGNVWARYAHLLPGSVDHLTDGQVAKRGDLIGKVDNTGYSTGSHLHYEISVGLSFPLPYKSACGQ